MKNQKRITVEDLKKEYPTAVVIHNWDELRQIPKDSGTHILEVEEYTGGITSKENNGMGRYYYLSTHTFYGKNFVNSTRELQAAGFNVIIDNWDAEENE